MSSAADRTAAGSVLADLSLPALIPAIEENEDGDMRADFGILPGAESGDDGDLLWVVAGHPVPWLNRVGRVRLRPEVSDRRIEEVLERCRSRGLPQEWHVFPTTEPTDLGERLTAHGIHRHDDMPMMAADLRHLRDDQAGPASVRIHRVTDERTREWFLSAFIRGFGMEDPLPDVFRYLVTNAGPSWQRFVAVSDGEPVATAGIHLAGGVAGLYNVQTVEPYRRRGIARAISMAALRDARDLGYRVAVLGTSTMGRSVYEGLGFRDVCAMQTFRWWPDADTGER